VAERAQISTSEVVDLHSAGEYRVSCIGFTPAFRFFQACRRNWQHRDEKPRAKKFPLARLGSAARKQGSTAAFTRRLEPHRPHAIKTF